MAVTVVTAVVLAGGTGPSSEYGELAATSCAPQGQGQRWEKQGRACARPKHRQPLQVPSAPVPLPGPESLHIPCLSLAGEAKAASGHSEEIPGKDGDMAGASTTPGLPRRGSRVGRVPWEGSRAWLSPATAPRPQAPRAPCWPKQGDALTARGKVGAPRALIPPFPRGPQDGGHGVCQPPGGGTLSWPEPCLSFPPARGGHMRDGWQATPRDGKGETGPRCHGNQDGLDFGQTERTAPDWHHVPPAGTPEGFTATPAKRSPHLGRECNPSQRV